MSALKYGFGIVVEGFRVRPHIDLSDLCGVFCTDRFWVFLRFGGWCFRDFRFLTSSSLQVVVGEGTGNDQEDASEQEP